MVPDDRIKDCKYNLTQIIHFNPDPHYVAHFFQEYIHCVVNFYEEILQEANRDFGLFISEKCTVENFERKAIEKNDDIVLKFLVWFKGNRKKEHNGTYANFIKTIASYYSQKKKIPKILIKILADQRYKDDPVHRVVVGLKEGKLKSKDELKIEEKRQTPIFLEIINQKRESMGEPKVNENQVILSTFLEIKNLEDIEIPQACEIYISVMNRFLEDSRKKIKQLTTRNNF